MRGAAWLVAAATTAVALMALPAHGQSARYRPEPEDFDQAAENESGLWERVLHPHHARYQALLSRARDLARRGDASSRDEAAEVLRQAIELVPDQPMAYWLLGSLEEEREQWVACADAYGRLLALEPNFQPPGEPPLPSGRKTDFALDFGLAMCARHAGDLERAVAHLTRILGRGITEQALVYLRLGEVYMALGRLDEALDALTRAERLQPGNWRVHYSLAVAYDRDEKEAQARAAMFEALRYDPELKRLEEPDARFAPAADALYYQGLARAVRGEIAWATAFFRHYLHATGDGPWRRRAEQHLGDLAREDMLGPEHVVVEDSLPADVRAKTQAAAIKAVTAASSALRQCVAATPGLLMEVRITVTGSAARLPRNTVVFVKRTPPAGIKAHILHSFATEPEHAERAQQCVESVAQSMSIPQPPGGPEQYAAVRFLLIAPASQAGREPAR